METFSALSSQHMTNVNLGPYSFRKAIDQFYNVSGELDRKYLLCRGVYLYQEITLNSSNPLMANRIGSLCNIAFSGMDASQTVRGFSRIKRFGTLDQPCKLNY